MVDPISTTTTPLQRPELDDMLRDVVGTHREEATSGPRPDDSSLLDFGATIASGVSTLVDGIGLFTGAALVAEAATVLGIGSTYASYAGTILEGERRGVAFDSEMMRGALATLEGRIRDPDVVAARASSPGFEAGVRKTETYIFRQAERARDIIQRVQSVYAEGGDAVRLGRDSGRAFTRRYEQDPVFRDGVDIARRQRTEDPTAFEAASRETRALHEALERSRGASPIAG